MAQSYYVSISSDVISSVCRLRVPNDGRSSDCGWFYLDGRVRPDKSEVGYPVCQHSGHPSLQDQNQRHCSEEKCWLPDLVMFFIFLIFNPLNPSGHYMYRTVVTICTAQWSLYVPPTGQYMYRQVNIHNPTFCPHSVFMCFVWISEQTAIISLYNIN